MQILLMAMVRRDFAIFESGQFDVSRHLSRSEYVDRREMVLQMRRTQCCLRRADFLCAALQASQCDRVFGKAGSLLRSTLAAVYRCNRRSIIREAGSSYWFENLSSSNKPCPPLA